MRRYRLLPLLLAAVCASGGCAPPLHAREADQLLMIQTLGFDGAPGRVRVSLSAPRETEEKDRMCLTGSGRSLIQAVRSAQQAAPREELFNAHIRFVAVGEDAARAGIGPVLDYFERGPQTRLDQPLLVVRGESAETLVAGSRDPEFEVTDMLSSLRQEAETEGSPRFYTLLETARSLADHGAALCCAVEVRPAEDAVPTAEEGALTLATAGYAVLRDGALRGFLSREEARGADLLLGRVSPSGKLPVTFYYNDQLGEMPEFTDYSMHNRTYRYFAGKPLYPFGYGLTYGDAAVTEARAEWSEAGAEVTVTVENKGAMDTDEVVQIYCQNEGSENAPLHPRLAAFRRVHVPAGQRIQAVLPVEDRRMQVVTDAGEKISEGRVVLYVGLGQPDERTRELTGHSALRLERP